MCSEIPRFILDRSINLLDKSVDEDKITGISNYDCGATIEEVVAKSRLLDYEVASLFDSNMQRFYCATTYEARSGRISIPDSWLHHVHLFVHNHPKCNETFSRKDLEAIHAFGCPNALVVCQNLSFLLEGLPHDWSTEAPTEMQTPEALGSLIDRSAASWYGDPILAYDEAIESMVLRLCCGAKLNCKYTVFDTNGNVVITRPGATDITQILHYHDILHNARIGRLSIFSKCTQQP